MYDAVSQMTTNSRRAVDGNVSMSLPKYECVEFSVYELFCCICIFKRCICVFPFFNNSWTHELCGCHRHDNVHMWCRNFDSRCHGFCLHFVPHSCLLWVCESLFFAPKIPFQEWYSIFTLSEYHGAACFSHVIWWFALSTTFSTLWWWTQITRQDKVWKKNYIFVVSGAP